MTGYVHDRRMFSNPSNATTSDKDILKAEILRRVVYKKAEELMTGKAAVNLEGMDALELKLTLPTSTRLDPQEISEGAKADLQHMEWFDVTQVMKKEQVRILVTDEARARMLSDIQTRYSINAAARGLAFSKDTDIFTTLAAGSAGSDAAGTAWNAASGADPARNIATTIGTILNNTVAMDSDVSSIVIFYPMRLYGFLKKPIEIGQMYQSIARFVEAEYQIGFIPTRQLTTSALVVMKSDETAMHVTYTGSSVPTAEQDRLAGVGDEYILTQYFKTFIVPEAEGGSTNNRIRTITGVYA